MKDSFHFLIQMTTTAIAGQGEVRNRKLHLGVPHGLKRSERLTVLCCFHGCVRRNRTGSGATGTQTCTWNAGPTRELNPLHFNTDPFVASLKIKNFQKKKINIYMLII